MYWTYTDGNKIVGEKELNLGGFAHGSSSMATAMFFCYISNLVKFDIWKHLNIPYFMTALFTQTKSKDGLMDATLHMKKIAEVGVTVQQE